MGRPVDLKPLPKSLSDVDTSIKIEPTKRAGFRTLVKSAHTGSSQATERQQKVREHPIIIKRIAEHEHRRREALASRNEWVIKNAPPALNDVDRRCHSILSNLLYALEEGGGRVSATEKGNLRVHLQEENVEFLIREKRKQTRVVSNLGGHVFSKQELVGTGKLMFSILTYWPGHYSTAWNETDSVRLDTRVPNMLDRILEGVAALKAWRIKQEEEEERRRKVAEERAERQRQAELERSRRQKLVELAGDWQVANVIRGLIAALRSKGIDGDSEAAGKPLGDWMAWADEIADDLDATRDGAASFFSAIATEGSQRP